MKKRATSALPLSRYKTVLAKIPTKSDLAVSYSQLKKEDINSSEAFPTKDEFFGVINSLNALGAIKITSNEKDISNSKISYVSDGAKDFVVSLALCAELGIAATDSWNHKFNPNVDSIWSLLQEMERRRRDNLKKGERDVVRSEEVVVVLIKGQMTRLGKTRDVFLCKLDEDSGFYNFIGGKLRYGEDAPKTVKRKLHDELSIPADSDMYQIEPIDILGSEIVTKKISNESGVYTEYHFHLFHAKNITTQPTQRDQKNKWFETEEIFSGKGSRGERIMTHPEIIDALRTRLNTKKYPKGLIDLDYSINDTNKFNAISKENQWWNKVVFSYGSLLTFIATLLTIITGVIGLVITILKLIGFVK